MKVENKSGLEPRGVAVLIKPYEPNTDSLIIIPDMVKERQKMLEIRGVVIAIGSEAWQGESQPRAKVGDKVLVAKFGGAMAQGPLDGEVYRMINADDIYAVITGEKE